MQNELNNVSLRTPHRIKHITRTLKSYVESLKENNLQVALDLELPNGDIEFRATTEHVMHCSSNMVRYDCNRNISFESPVIVPIATSCCMKKFRIDPRAAQIRIYTENGIVEGVQYHAFCRQCKNKFYRHYTENKDGYRNFLTKDEKYFFITSSLGFSSRFLDKVSLQISIGATSFEKISEMYNEEFDLIGNEKKLSAEVIENSWLIYRIVIFFPKVLWHKKDHNKHCDVERICQDVYPILKKKIDEKWFSHECKETGM